MGAPRGGSRADIGVGGEGPKGGARPRGRGGALVAGQVPTGPSRGCGWRSKGEENSGELGRTSWEGWGRRYSGRESGRFGEERRGEVVKGRKDRRRWAESGTGTGTGKGTS